MSAPNHQSDWERLFRIGRALIDQVNSEQTIIDHWTFGGGTAMMIQIDHRESHDVDLFLPDPQLLSYLDPKLHDFKFEIAPSGYGGDGTGFMKISFEKGEIDFIVGREMTSAPTTTFEIAGVPTLLETVPEIITKKVVYRGKSFRPRDIFDMAAAAEQHADAIIEALRSYPDEVAKTIETLNRLNPDFANDSIAQLMLRDKYRDLSKTAIDRAREVLASV